MRRRDRIRRNFRRACQYRSAPMQFADLVSHKLRLNTYWEDYYRYGFYKPDMPWSQKALYVSDFGSHYYPWEGNSLKFDRLFVRKSLQKAVLIAHGLPTPRFFVKVGLLYSVNTAGALARELEKIDVPFVTKFDGGGGGVLNMVFEPEAGRFRCKDKLVDAQWIWDQYAHVANKGFLIEEHVRNHPALAAMHPGSFNTLRIITVKTVDEQWHVLRPYLKIGRHGTHVDNVCAGGLFAAVDSHGVLGDTFSNEGERFERHPDTGVEIKGVEVPCFNEALDLALEASRTFGFMKTIGWDIGITPLGPTILEGNPYWTAEYIQDELGPFLTPEVAAGLVPRSWWMPWDRARMYPNYMRHTRPPWWQRFISARRWHRYEKLRAGPARAPNS